MHPGISTPVIGVDDFRPEPEGDPIPPLTNYGDSMQSLLAFPPESLQAGILTKEEVFRMIDCAPNVRHRLLIQLLYGCGLLASEAMRLKVEDVDLEKNMIYVRQGNRRCIPLPRGVSRSMEFFLKYNQDDVHLFPNGYVEGHLSIESAERIIGYAAAAAGLGKPVSSYTLRHSFAAHLFECGTKVAVIQTLLGNYDATRLKHMHTSEDMISKTRSPLDSL